MLLISDKQRLDVLNTSVTLMAWLAEGPDKTWAGTFRQIEAGQDKSCLLRTSASSTPTSILNGLEKNYITHLMVGDVFRGTSEASMTGYLPHDRRFPQGYNRLRSLLDQIIWSRRLEPIKRLIGNRSPQL